MKLTESLCGCVRWAVVLFMTLVPLIARADLLISPTRVLLTGEQRTAQVTLRNTGEDRRTYRIEWREMRRDDSGAYISIEQPGPDDRIASPVLRYSPRQITLEGGEMQTVRVQYQPRADMAAGEYRSHLRFSTVGAEPDQIETEGGKGAVAAIQIGIAFSIPVIARVGAPIADTSVHISQVQPRMETNPRDGMTRLALDVTVERSGAYSSFGDLNVYMQERADSPIVLIGKAADFTVFADAARRPITIPLREDIQVPPGAWVRVSYEGKQEYAGRVLAEQVFQIQ